MNNQNDLQTIDLDSLSTVSGGMHQGTPHPDQLARLQAAGFGQDAAAFADNPQLAALGGAINPAQRTALAPASGGCCSKPGCCGQ